MVISRKRAIRLGLVAIGCIVVLHAINTFGCGNVSIGSFLTAFAIFMFPPLIPGLLSLVSANPLRTVGASLLLAPWLIFAYYVDCIAPYSGGGASMVYVAVLLWGTLSAVLGALATGPILRMLGIQVGGR